MSYMQGSLVKKTAKLIQARVIAKPPKWFRAAVKCPPLSQFMPGKEPKEIVLPEDPYVKEIYKRIPGLKYEAFDPSAFSNGTGRALARRWMQLIELGFLKDRALDIVEGEYSCFKRAKNRAYDEARYRARCEGREAPPPRKMIKRFQEYEKELLKKGLRKLKERKEAEAAIKVAPKIVYEDSDDDD